MTYNFIAVINEISDWITTLIKLCNSCMCVSSELFCFAHVFLLLNFLFCFTAKGIAGRHLEMLSKLKFDQLGQYGMNMGDVLDLIDLVKQKV